MPLAEHNFAELPTGSICSMMLNHNNRASLPSILSAHRSLPCSIKRSGSPTLETTTLASDPAAAAAAASFIPDPGYISSQVNLIDTLHSSHESTTRLLAEKSGMASTARTSIAEVNIRSNSSTDRLQTRGKFVLSVRSSRDSLDTPCLFHRSLQRTWQSHTRETRDP